MGNFASRRNMSKEGTVFICGAHKSGTTLLRSLLDGHPDLLAVPFETHFFRASGFWVDNDYKFHWPTSRDEKTHRDTLRTMLDKRNAGSRQFSDTAFQSVLDLDSFENLWSSRDSDSLTDRWKAFVAFLRKEMGSGSGLIIEKSVENAEMASMIAAEIPDSKFIHISRNPYANLVALREFRRKNYTYPLLPRAIRTLYNNFYFAYRNQLSLGDRLLHIQFEELLLEPELTMQKVASFIGIPFDDKLLRPTSMDKDWKGNSTSEKDFKGIDKAPLENYKEKLSAVEIEFVNRALGPVLSEFGYQKQASGNYWIPGKGEGIRRYLYNRMYLPFMKRYDKPI